MSRLDSQELAGVVDPLLATPGAGGLQLLPLKNDQFLKRQQKRRGIRCNPDVLITLKDGDPRRERLRSLHCYFAWTSLAPDDAPESGEASSSSGSGSSGIIFSSEREVRGSLFEEEEEEEDDDLSEQSHKNDDDDNDDDCLSLDVTHDRIWRKLPTFKFKVCLPDAVGWLRENIGAPPRRPLDDPEPPVTLLWAGDLGIICAVAGVALFVSAFAAEGEEGGMGLLTLDEEKQQQLVSGGAEVISLVGAAAADQFQNIPSRGALAVVWLSALAGGALNIRHAVRAALLTSI